MFSLFALLIIGIMEINALFCGLTHLDALKLYDEIKGDDLFFNINMRLCQKRKMSISSQLIILTSFNSNLVIVKCAYMCLAI